LKSEAGFVNVELIQTS